MRIWTYIRKHLPYLGLVCLAALWTTLCYIVPDFSDTPFESVRELLTPLVFVIALGIMQFLILLLLLLNRYVCAVLLPLYAILGSIVSYYRVAYHATITPMMVDVTFHTNAGTVAGVVSWALVGWICLNVLIASAVVYVRWTRVKPYQPWLVLVVGCGLLFGYYHFNGRLHQSINQRYPLNVLKSLEAYARIAQERKQERVVAETECVECVADSVDVVFVIGEACRADHWSLNGYERETCPRLARQANVVSLPHVYSEYTYTAGSVPHIMTPADSLHPEYANTYSSFIRCFADRGFSTAWLSNQDYGHTYTSFISEADTVIFPNADKTVFVFHPWYDEDLLSPLDGLMAEAAERGSGKNLYVLHTIGSHWYFNNHVPEAMQLFQPVTQNRMAVQNTEEEMINAYDNTVYYVDYILDELIERLADRRAILFYLADHGEALGEDGCWLHANDAEVSHYPAAMVWYSDGYAQMYPEKVAALRANSERRYRTDYLYYSILSAIGVEAKGDNAGVDIFLQE